MKQKKLGTCQLTGSFGQFVKCHIIPQALTKPSIKGAPLVQPTKNGGMKRRWSSWYDAGIVTREGEDILSVIDDKAIKVLRKYQLIWESWKVYKPHFRQVFPPNGIHCYRILRIEEQDELKRFFLSILWRASVSTLPDLEELNLGSKIESEIRSEILSESIRLNFLPVSLTQLSTIGEKQNMLPIRDLLVVPDIERDKLHEQDTIRIYVDGLIAHIHLDSSYVTKVETHPAFLCNSEELHVSSVTYEESFQRENLLISLYESYFGPFVPVGN